MEKYWKKILRRKKFSLLAFPAILLWVVSLFYRIAVALDRRKINNARKVSLPLISIGNITIGGTGKTPLVEMLSRFFLNEGYRVGIVSSGYGRSNLGDICETGYKIQNMAVEDIGDEVKYLSSLLPEAEFSISRDKTKAAEFLAEKGLCDLIIVDDGFQHFGLKRDIDIVTYDAAIKDRYMKTFPFGLMRESHSALKRAEIIIITRANFAKDIGILKKKIERINPEAMLFDARFLSSELVDNEKELSDKYLEDKSVFLFAGIGNFKALKKQVKALSTDLDHALELADHQVYDEKILNKIKQMADKHDSDVIVTTGKDWVKIDNFDFGREFYYLNQHIDLDPGEEKLVKHLIEKLKLTKQVEN